MPPLTDADILAVLRTHGQMTTSVIASRLATARGESVDAALVMRRLNELETDGRVLRVRAFATQVCWNIPPTMKDPL